MSNDYYSAHKSALRIADHNNAYMSGVVGRWSVSERYGQPKNIETQIIYGSFAVEEVQVRCHQEGESLCLEYCVEGAWLKVSVEPDHRDNGWLVYYLQELNLFLTVLKQPDGWQIYGQKEIPYCEEDLES